MTMIEAHDCDSIGCKLLLLEKGVVWASQEGQVFDCASHIRDSHLLNIIRFIKKQLAEDVGPIDDLYDFEFEGGNLASVALPDYEQEGPVILEVLEREASRRELPLPT